MCNFDFHIKKSHGQLVVGEIGGIRKGRIVGEIKLTYFHYLKTFPYGSGILSDRKLADRIKF